MAESQSSMTILVQTLLIALIVSFILKVPAVFAQPPSPTQVNIFGDGDPDNGIEDSREQILGGRRRAVSLDDQRMSAGTIKCDGKIRGTAMVIDTREYAPDLRGVVLMSAAHVLFDLDKGERFQRCEFYFLALGEYARYRIKIDLANLKMGNFDPAMATGVHEFGEGDWVFMYAPKAWRGYEPNEALVVQNFSFQQMESYRRSGGEVRLIAFDSTEGVISVSGDCNVFESGVDDLGGGQWPGQLLDDCDSAGGASGGGIVVVFGEKRYLIGIRGGSHWNKQVFPDEKYPNGPPDGSVWDSHSNTNFGRAIDAGIIQVLQEFTRNIEQDEVGF